MEFFRGVPLLNAISIGIKINARKAIRCMVGVNRYVHIEHLFSQLKILKLDNVYKLHLGHLGQDVILKYNIGPINALFY